MFGGMNINDMLYKNIDFGLVFISLIKIGNKNGMHYPCSRNNIILYTNTISLFSHDFSGKRMLINDWYYKKNWIVIG